jgi:hypothetical protein
MFVRFRQTDRRLQTSIAATRRADGRVVHEHVAGLGSVPRSPSPGDRIAFWTKLHQRLDGLSNRIDASQRGAILTTIHARIPMPTLDEQQAVRLDLAQKDVRFWSSLAEAQADDLEGHKQLLATTQDAITEREPLAADTASKAQAARDRLVRVEQGEAIAVPAPMTHKDFLRLSGMTEAQAQHCVRVSEIANAGDHWWQRMRDEQDRRTKVAEKAVVRKLHRLLVKP